MLPVAVRFLGWGPLPPYRCDQFILVVHIQNVGGRGAVQNQAGNGVRVGFGQGFVSHERVHELAMVEILDSVAHGRNLDRTPPTYNPDLGQDRTNARARELVGFALGVRHRATFPSWTG
jgi:hypothetical protein